MSNKDWDKLDKLFSNEMQKRTKKIEEQIVSNVKHSLDNIYNKITKDFNKINETGQVYNGRPVGELN
jgi:hypothetical protein